MGVQTLSLHAYDDCHNKLLCNCFILRKQKAHEIKYKHINLYFN